MFLGNMNDAADVLLDGLDADCAQGATLPLRERSIKLRKYAVIIPDPG